MPISKRLVSTEEVEEGPKIVFFVMIGLLIGAVLREVNKRTKIPYTPMLLLVGIIIGELVDELGILGESAQKVQNMSPHMILLVFIPVLIFESSFNCEWHVFRKSLANILLLAGPGVLIGAGLNAICFKIILRYPDEQMSWYQALTLGSILSATDPVAVVSLLKQLGASTRFNTLVEGQSLLNDGTGMVFFALFLGLSKGEETTGGDVVLALLRTAGGGWLLGVVMGVVVGFWVKRIIRDPILSMAVTLVAAYLTFYIAEFTILKVSGILALVCFGLYMAAEGKRTIYPTSDYALHKVWSFIQYSCETLIFILTGVVFGVVVINRSTTISGADWGKVFLLWILMIVTRCIMVLILYPFLSRCGYGLTRRQMIVLVYGGLRGALGLTLSLIVTLDEDIPHRFRELTVFFTCGIAVLTIVVNGLTCEKIVNALGMVSYPHIKRKLLSKCVRDVLHNTQNKFRQLRNEPSVCFADWQDVEELAELEKLGIYEVEDPEGSMNDFDELETSEMVEEIRFRFNRYLDKLCWDLFTGCEISDTSIDLLSEMCEVINDDLGSGLLYWEILSKNFSVKTFPYYVMLKNIPIIGRYFNSKLIAMVYTTYESTTTFVQCCEETIEMFKSSFPLHISHLNFVLKEVKENLEEAVNYAYELEVNYPSIVKAVHTKKAVTILLDHKSFVLKEMYKEGFMDEVDFEKLKQELSQKIIDVRHRHFELHDAQFHQILTATPLFAILPTYEVPELLSHGHETHFAAEEIVVKPKQLMADAIFILSGSLKENFDNFYFRKGIGSVLNPNDLFYQQPSQASIEAVTPIKALKVPKEKIFELLSKYPEFKKKWIKSMFPYAINMSKLNEIPFQSYTQRQLRVFMEMAKVEFIVPGRTLDLKHGGYVFEGKVEDQKKNMSWSQGNFIPAQSAVVSVSPSASVMKFENSLVVKSKVQRVSQLYKADQ